MANVIKGCGDQIVVQCIQKCPRGQLTYQCTDIDAVIAFCRNKSRVGVNRWDNPHDKISSTAGKLPSKTVKAPPSKEAIDDSYACKDNSDSLVSKVTTQRFRNNIDVHRITSFYEVLFLHVPSLIVFSSLKWYRKESCTTRKMKRLKCNDMRLET